MDTCKLCKNTYRNDVLSVKQTGSRYRDQFIYIQCSDCRSLTISEVPENLSDYYEDYYSFKPFIEENDPKLAFSFKSLLYPTFFQRHPLDSLAINALKLLKPSKEHRILDVGCGSGKFVYDLHNLGFGKAIGIDPFISEDIEYRNGAKALKLGLEEVEGKYDIITFHHTLEHFSEIDKCLKTAKQLLSKDGYFIIRIPNIMSYSAKKFGAHWTGIHAPYHLNLPSYEAMTRILNSLGLQIFKLVGEQLHHFLLSNVENSYDLIHNGSEMFRKFAPIHTRSDIRYAKNKTKLLCKSPELSEWINYYVKIS